MNPQTALRHWAAWCVDAGSWRTTCYSIEGRYSRNPRRFDFDDDRERAARSLEFRYDQRVAENVEQVINRLPEREKEVMRARFVRFPHLEECYIARRIGMPYRNFETVLCAAHARFGRMWREEMEVA